MKKVTIYTDGSSHGNPGPGGYGAIIEYIDSKGIKHEKEISEGFKNTTNNRMELLGPIMALSSLNTPCEVLIVSDSKYLIDAFEKKWIDSWQKNGWKNSKKEPVKNPDLWQKLLKVMEPHKISFKWVKGHASHPQNERCDQMANAAANGSDLKHDM